MLRLASRAASRSAVRLTAQETGCLCQAVRNLLVVVGESDYDAALNFAPLRFAGKDAEDLAQILEKAGYTIVGDCPPEKALGRLTVVP